LSNVAILLALVGYRHFIH